MFSLKELTLIISALATESVNAKRMIAEKRYCCKEELDALQRAANDIENLANKISKLIENILKKREGEEI